MHISVITYLIGFLIIYLSFFKHMIENSSANSIALEMLNNATGDNDTPESILKFLFVVSLFWPLIVLCMVIINVFKYIWRTIFVK